MHSGGLCDHGNRRYVLSLHRCHSQPMLVLSVHHRTRRHEAPQHVCPDDFKFNLRLVFSCSSSGLFSRTATISKSFAHSYASCCTHQI